MTQSYYEQRLDELFEKEKEDILETQKKLTEKSQAENNNKDISEQELRDELIDHLSDSYKSVFGSRPRHFNFNEMSIDELKEKCDQVQEFVVNDIALGKAQDKLYQERYEQAKNTEGALISENPEFELHSPEDEYNRPYNIYIPDEDSQKKQVGNFLGDKFPDELKKGIKEPPKKRNTPNKP